MKPYGESRARILERSPQGGSRARERPRRRPGAAGLGQPRRSGRGAAARHARGAQARPGGDRGGAFALAARAMLCSLAASLRGVWSDFGDRDGYRFYLFRTKLCAVFARGLLWKVAYACLREVRQECQSDGDTAMKTLCQRCNQRAWLLLTGLVPQQLLFWGVPALDVLGNNGRSGKHGPRWTDPGGGPPEHFKSEGAMDFRSELGE